MIDATLQVMDVQVSAPDPDAEAGPQGGVLQLAMIVGMGLPVSPTQIAQIPAGVVRVNLGKERSEALGKEISEAAETLKAPSKLVVSGDINAAEQAAQAVQGFRDGPQRQGS